LLLTALNTNFMLSSFAVMALFKLMLIMIVEVRYLLVVWKASYEEAHPDATPEELGRECGAMMRRLIGVLLLVLFFTCKIFPRFPPIALPLCFFWTPQIVWDVWKGQRRSFSWQFLLGLSVCRLALPLYCWALPPKHSIFDGEVFAAIPGAPSIAICVTIASIVVLQTVLSCLQRVLGSRFFVPSRYLPQVYNYYRQVPELKTTASAKHKKTGAALILKALQLAEIRPTGGSDTGGTNTDAGTAESAEADIEAPSSVVSDDLLECVICMVDIKPTDCKRVVTPCDHFFHESCLRQWMEVKMECPTCRGLLPPFP